MPQEAGLGGSVCMSLELGSGCQPLQLIWGTCGQRPAVEGLSGASQGACRRVLVPRHKNRGVGEGVKNQAPGGWLGGDLG